MTETPKFQCSADTRLLFQLMERAEMGQVITYEAMGNAISRPVSGASQPLRTALHKLLRERNMVFACIHGRGFQRLDDGQIVAQGEHEAKRIRRHAVRALEKQMKADFSRMNREQQARFTAQSAVLSTIAYMAKEKQISRIASAAKPDDRKFSIASTLKMFAGTKETNP